MVIKKNYFLLFSLFLLHAENGMVRVEIPIPKLEDDVNKILEKMLPDKILESLKEEQFPKKDWITDNIKKDFNQFIKDFHKEMSQTKVNNKVVKIFDKLTENILYLVNSVKLIGPIKNDTNALRKLKNELEKINKEIGGNFTILTDITYSEETNLKTKILTKLNMKKNEDKIQVLNDLLYFSPAVQAKLGIILTAVENLLK